MTSLAIPVISGVPPSYSNFVGWTADPESAATLAPASGDVIAAAGFSPFSGLVSQIIYEITTAGVAVTTGLFGIYLVQNPTLAVLAATSVDQSATMNAGTGRSSASFGSSILLPASTYTNPTWWVVGLQVFTTSVASLRVGYAATNIANFGGANQALRAQRVAAGASVLPASFNPQASVTVRALLSLGVAA